MFKREQHNKILTVLNHLNADFLVDCRAYFGGGTLVNLKHGEYRLSQNIYFMCPKGESYHYLRRKVMEMEYDAIFKRFDNIALPREIQAHQHGLRFPVIVDQMPIKFEIAVGMDFKFGIPDYPNWSSVPCLNETDNSAIMLLNNAFRAFCPRENSKDLIDLAALRLTAPIPAKAIALAEDAYSVIEPLKKAIQHFSQNQDYRRECFKALAVKAPKQILDGLDLLATDFGLELTVRTKSNLEWEWSNYNKSDVTSRIGDLQQHSELIKDERDVISELAVPQELPFLKAVCWQTADVKHFTLKQMLGRYEDGWRYLDILGEPSSEELRFIKQLINRYSSWLATDV